MIYVSGFDPDVARSLYIDEAVSPMDIVLSVNYGDAEKRVEAGALGLWAATAEMREGVGCTLTTTLGDRGLDPVELSEVEDKPLPTMAQEDVEAVFDVEVLETAIDDAFDPSYNTLAIVVVHGDEVVTERYARVVDASTPLPGWSMAKSMTATVVGLLVKDGRMDVTEPGVIDEWADDTDGGAEVTIDHLLRMTGGIDVVEDQSGADPNSRMLMVEADKAAYAARRGLSSTPGEHWEYMSGSTVLVSREVVQATGGTLESSQQFIRQELLEPLGAASFVVEPDAAGTFVGSSFMLASARDWAKLGLLYLNDGVWEGERLLPEGWGEYVTTYTPESGEQSYGAGFWTLEHSRYGGLPRDTFYASGFQGQFIFMIPAYDLVFVRLGASHETSGILTFAENLVEAMR